MQPNSAYKLIPIVVGTDYTPTQQYTTHDDPNTGPTSPPGPTVANGLNSPIYAMFCTATNSGTTKVRLLGDTADISFPSGSFKQGVVYYVYLKKLVDDGGGSFIGYLYQQYPFIL
jgi:hypothetical protein